MFLEIRILNFCYYSYVVADSLYSLGPQFAAHWVSEGG